MNQDPFRPGFVRRLKKRQAAFLESSWEASKRFGLPVEKIEEMMRKGRLVYTYSPKYKKRMLVSTGYSEEKEREREIIEPIDVVKGFFRFFIRGPGSKAEIVVWMLLLPVTLPILVVCQIIIAYFAAILAVCAKSRTYYYFDGGGGGLFDEVSTRRREDLQFLLGIGKYSKENW